MAYSLALIDLDGTLTDSAPGIIASIEHAYGALGLPVPSPADLALFVGPPIEVSATRHGVPAVRLAEFIAAYREAFVGGGMLDNSVYPGVEDALVQLRAAGLRMCVATSKPEVFAIQIMEHFGIAGYFDAICGATLDGVRSTKADVVAHALATMAGQAEQAGLPVRSADEIVMVGDREHDVLGARAHGLPTVAVGWGYAAAGELDEARALAVVATPAELVERLLA